MGTRITFQNNSYPCGDESVLDRLLKAGVFIPHSCKSGLCQACEMKLIEGEVPQKSTAGLSDHKIQAKHFLACQCFPEQDLKISLVDENTQCIEVTVIDKVKVNRSIIKLVLEPKETVNYLAGQYLRLYQTERECRCYSIASNPDQEDFIELHIQIIANGKVSNWIAEEVMVGDTLRISEAMGSCIYPDHNTASTLFVASNSGLAPIYGMIKKALSQGDQQPLHLMHGITHEKDKYLVAELTALQQLHHNLTVDWFDYSQIKEEKHRSFIHFALTRIPSPQDWKVYFCGHPELVSYGKKQFFLKGVSMKNLYSDAFLPSKVN
ncbi:MAG: hypothetical protein B7Z60_06915 [Ferrovum sp. 37-45-19]|uniref:2Fe-2S iron-sulfur cluster-binding protein n=1 Tax=Ferrovum sp. JA12 TaxID=1356299 RepID=UPI0007039E3F|nr:2Fe-2S iron-sulfur cluster binding domain-containing protein [Ferrovum sp. JA12]OYV78767.1 MAG: hypothetical protein B7Z65_08930 [Ferrovum sp. 21-44-67]OYV93927.1 MAG: hypothetical protein B7Z60_06915 [Ferrovum sp. 37-45-19]OZB32005.1 MAG: hypothetical protein B7X47_07745 [Ferrovum sp. 34-44-207]HQT81984.1 2Fe-2S iron-sulfur cluster binding domain-containing protein [Ferrovaceae bacterium]KRH78967.1 CDP-6-deoxy-L-threo-D-glycero-4-hexulose-3-dehydrase reductase [Ferrovum sp. JA12]